jgi:hypothetical protein
MSLTSSVLGVAALILSSTFLSVAFGSKGEFIGHWEGALVREGAPLEGNRLLSTVGRTMA